MTLIIILIKYKGVIYKALELEKRVRVRPGEREKLDKRRAREETYTYRRACGMGCHAEHSL